MSPTHIKKDCSFIDGFKYIGSLGGDTDTNCAIYGAIKSYRCDEDLYYNDFLTENIIDFPTIDYMKKTKTH